MSSMSIAVIVGRLTRDSELKYTSGGSPIAKFSVATNHRKKEGDRWVDESDFWEVELWGKQGESLNQYLTKGKLVAIEGQMRQDKWEQEGVKRLKVVVNAETVQLLSSKSSEDSHSSTQIGQGGKVYGNTPQPAAPSREPMKAANQEAPETDLFEDDIPF